MKIKTKIDGVVINYNILPGGEDVIIEDFVGSYTNQRKREIVTELQWQFRNVYVSTRGVLNTPLRRTERGLLVV